MQTQVSEHYMWRALDDVKADPYIANEDSLCPGVSWPYFATSVHTVWIVLDSGTNRSAVSTCSDNNRDTTRHIAIWPRQPSTQTCFPLSFKPDRNGFSVSHMFSQKLSKFFLQLDFMTEWPDIRLTGLHSCKDTFQKPQLTLGRVCQALTNKITECQRVRGGDVCQSCKLIWAEYLRMQTILCVPRSIKKQSRSSDRGQSVPSRRLQWPQMPVFSVTLRCMS